MSIQLSGATPLDYTFTSAGTRADLVTQFITQLGLAGWTNISGGIMESHTTPQGLKIRVEAVDPGSGNCAQFRLRDGGSLVGPTVISLLPVNGSVFRIWANKYQFFFFLSGTNMTTQRSLVCGGVPWVPQFIQDAIAVPYGGWLHGNGASDTDATPLASTFRKAYWGGTIKTYSAIWNGSTFGSNFVPNNFGLIAQTANTAIDDQWEDGTFTIFEPILIWQSTSFSTPVRHGQMWDAVIGSKPLDSEVRRTFGNLTWRNITHQNTAAPRGSLFLQVPI